jgi:hypothetical protein
MFNEPHIYDDNYMQAEVIVLADSEDEALDLLKKDDKWNIEELKRIKPITVALDQPCIVSKSVYFG